MKAFLIFWGIPIGFFWGWYFLSLNDFGFGFFSREMHDMVFQVYGEILHMDPTSVPAVLAKASVVDTLLLGVLVALRRRRQIMEWWRNRSQAVEINRDEPLMFDPAAREAGRVLPAE